MPTDPKTALVKLFGLTPADRDKVDALWKEYVRRYSTPTRDPDNAPEYDPHQGPEFYVGKTGPGGVTEIVGDTAGTGTVTVYQFVGDDGDPPDGLEVVDFDVAAYNVGGAVGGDEWVQIARDKYGRWWLVTPGAGGDSTFLAVLTKKVYLPGDHIAYSWSRVVNAPPWGYVEVCPYVRGCPGHTPAYHERGLDVPVVHNAPADGATGTDPCLSDDSTQCVQPQYIDRLSVFRLRIVGGATDRPTGTGTGTDQGGYAVFGGHPWVNLFRRTGVTDQYGEVAYHRYYDQETQTWQDGREVRLVEAE